MFVIDSSAVIALLHANRTEVPLTGLSDHFVSEALYLDDPDGHGIEIYWDRPREVWEGRVDEEMTTLPLDVDDLLGELPPGGGPEYAGMPAGTVMGHVHLRVADIDETTSFYRDVFGFAMMAHLGRRAAFFSAGGYHHHLGSNTWDSAGAGPAPAGVASLRLATIVLPDESARTALIERLEARGQVVERREPGPVIVDPSGNALLLAVAD